MSNVKLAIRTVSEDDNVHVIEGLGIPFGGPFRGGRDSYGTHASPRTDFHWDLFPDREPDDPPGIAARFTRPATFVHGFDPEVGLSRVGGWSPVRTDKRGVWVQMQLDKHHAYYEALRELLGENALGFSAGSAEHSVRFDDRTGEWVEWPMYELALTPTPSNPWAAVAARTAEAAKVLFRISGLRATDKSGKAIGPDEGGKAREDIPDEDFAGPDKSFPIVNQASVDDAARLIGKASDSAAVKAKVIAIANRKGLTIPDAWKSEPRTALRQAADDVACATQAQANIAYLMECESDEPEQVAMLRKAFAALGEFITAEAGEIGTDEDEAEEEPLPPGYMAYASHGYREGRRNSLSDQQRIDAIHDHAAALGASAHAGDQPPNDESHQQPAPDTAGRSAGKLPAVRVTQSAERLDAKRLDAMLGKALKAAGDIGSDIGSDIRLAG